MIGRPHFFILLLFLFAYVYKEPAFRELHDPDRAQPIIHSASIQELYPRNLYKGLWVSGGALTPVADTFMHFLSKCEDLGLQAEPYHYPALKLYKQQRKLSPKDSLSCELFMTDAFLSIIEDLQGKRWNDQVLDKDSVYVSYLKQNRLSLLFDLVQPRCAAYLNLCNFLTRYNESLRMGLQKIGIVNRSGIVKVFFSDSAVLENKEQEDLHKWLKEQIIVNLRKWRRTDEIIYSRYLLLNIPSFELTIYNRTQPVFHSRVIVGDLHHPTPELVSRITNLVIYPYWNVPNSILFKELLPQYLRDTTYFTRNRFILLDKNKRVLNPATIPWHKVNRKNPPFVLRQMEGDGNALGYIKFNFYNTYNVYLHDTHTKSLFDKKQRTFSHGCVRVQRARDLAFYLLNDEQHPLCDSLDALLAKKQHRVIGLHKPLPLHLAYFTCEMQHDTLVVFKDIYRRMQ